MVATKVALAEARHTAPAQGHAACTACRLLSVVEARRRRSRKGTRAVMVAVQAEAMCLAGEGACRAEHAAVVAAAAVLDATVADERAA